MNVRLVDLTLSVLFALRDGDLDTAAAQLGLDIPADFAGNVDIWEFMIARLDRQPANAGWTMQAIVRDEVIVGNAGFKGAPDADGVVELGYFVLEANRRQGLAMTAARLLLERAANEPTVSRVVATIDPANAPSIAVITAAGFQPGGDRIHERWGRQLVFAYPIQTAVAD